MSTKSYPKKIWKREVRTNVFISIQINKEKSLSMLRHRNPLRFKQMDIWKTHQILRKFSLLRIWRKGKPLRSLWLRSKVELRIKVLIRKELKGIKFLWNRFIKSIPQISLPNIRNRRNKKLNLNKFFMLNNLKKKLPKLSPRRKN